MTAPLRIVSMTKQVGDVGNHHILQTITETSHSARPACMHRQLPMDNLRLLLPADGSRSTEETVGRLHGADSGADASEREDVVRIRHVGRHGWDGRLQIHRPNPRLSNLLLQQNLPEQREGWPATLGRTVSQKMVKNWFHILSDRRLPAMRSHKTASKDSVTGSRKCRNIKTEAMQQVVCEAARYPSDVQPSTGSDE
ncbi:hypothetical protein C0Q70_05616 [Pomacea canaliculata]|uniref:Uncharacterized protein n=1 Tax=Pomacea canaliculata TaxID=400727 RepID=A0A2T7PLN5_POMCA|nr:hypothetical protein C0Q70_05616 [Pomacea canaliculata]